MVLPKWFIAFGITLLAKITGADNSLNLRLLLNTRTSRVVAYLDQTSAYMILELLT